MPFKIYRSSAGSGKTFTLVKEFLRIALASPQPDNYRGILAVTFTNKAAEEMKSRVIGVLGKLSEPEVEKEPMMDILQEELNLERGELAKRASATLKHMLHHYSDLSISTIDKFSHRIIRTFSQDLGLPVNFEVQLDKDPLEQAVYDQLMERVGSDELLTQVLVDFIRAATEDEKGWNIEKPIKKYIGVLFTEETRFHLDKLRNLSLEDFRMLRNRLKPEIEKPKNVLIQLAKQITKESKAAGLDVSKFSYGKTGIYNYVENAAKGDLKMPGTRVLQSIENDKFYGSKINSSEQAAIDLLKPKITQLVEQVETQFPSIQYREIVFNHIYGVALLDEMQRILKDVQQEEEIVHIGEFNHLISDVVMTESAPFIYERIGARYHHFLVDEFQDTSILQWFNLLPLVDESLAHDNLCLVVGDAKQSIYRWRGGDVQQFVKLPDLHRPDYFEEKLNENPALARLFSERERSLNAAKDVQPLDANFRSSPVVVEFNNSLFDFLQEKMPDGLKQMFDGARQIPKKELDGLIAVEAIRPEKDEKKDDYELAVFAQIQSWVDECLADGYAAGDISILFRTNKQAVKVALDLVGKGYDVVSNESLLIDNSPRVRLLVNLATYIDDPSNAVNVAELILNLNTLQSEDALSTNLTRSRGGTDAAYIDQLLEQWLGFPPSKLTIENPYQLFNILAHAFFNGTTEPNVTFFLDEVLAFGQQKVHSLSDFLEHWAEKREKLSIALDETPNSIRILTIHKSKGLEFPVVIHPFADYPERNNSDSAWVYLEDEVASPLDRLRLPMTNALAETPFAEDQAEEKARAEMDTYNEMYVALTRAKERLYVSGKMAADSKNDGTPKSPIQYIIHFLREKGSIANDALSYSIGTRAKKLKEVVETLQLGITHVGNPNWNTRLRIARPISEPDLQLHDLDARQLGIAIHEAMADVRTSADVRPAVKKLVQSGMIGQAEFERIESHIQNLIGRPELQPLYKGDGNLRNEADIQLSSGEWLRPDRVVTKGRKAWVVDYKNGIERTKHQSQMKAYVDAVAELGFEQVEGLLVYIELEKVVKI